MAHGRQMPGGPLLGLLTLLAVAMVALPAGCTLFGRQHSEPYLCFTPANPSLRVGDSLTLVVTMQPEEDESRKPNEESGWTWEWSSDDGGEIEFSGSDLQWSPPSDHIYMAQVGFTGVRAGTVTVELGQPSDKSAFTFRGTLSCIHSCTITVTAW